MLYAIQVFRLHHRHLLKGFSKKQNSARRGIPALDWGLEKEPCARVQAGNEEDSCEFQDRTNWPICESSSTHIWELHQMDLYHAPAVVRV